MPFQDDRTDELSPRTVSTPPESASSPTTAHELIRPQWTVPFEGLKTLKASLANSPSSPRWQSPTESLQKTVEPIKNTARWNTKDLGWRLGGDMAAAASAGIMISPIITVIDRSIIENASGKTTIMGSLRASLLSLLTRPHTFLASRAHLLIFAVYAGTYASANALDTASSTLGNKDASTTTSGGAKFAATSVANVSLCVYKDSQFTKMFGVAQNSAKVPLISKGLFTIRDCMTVFASFNLPPVLAPMLPLSKEVERHASRASIAQFLAPAGIQLFSTPLHLLGLDMYNNPKASAASRAAKVWKDWGKSCLARMARIVPAFGVGGVVNSKVRANLMSTL